MLGARRTGPTLIPATLEDDIPKQDGLHTFARGVVTGSDDGRLVVRSAGSQRSNLLGSIARADCLIHLPADWTEAPRGADVMVQMLGG